MKFFIAVITLLAVTAPLRALEFPGVSLEAIKALHLPAEVLPSAPPASPETRRTFLQTGKCWTRTADKEADRLGLPAEFCLSRLGLQTPADTLNIFDHRTVILSDGPDGLRQIQITGYANNGNTSSVSGYIFPGGRGFAAVYITASQDGTVLDKEPEIRGFIMSKTGPARELTYLPGRPFTSSSEKALRPEAAPETSEVTGFLTKFEGEYYVGGNLYFDHAGKSRLIEDLYARIQTFSLRGRDLYISVKGFGEFRLGAIDLDPAELKERETRKFRLTEKVTSSTFYHNWRAPKVGINFSAEITGFGFFTEVTERTQTIISLKTAAGGDFCLYENIPGRAKGVLYPGACAK